MRTNKRLLKLFKEFCCNLFDVDEDQEDDPIEQRECMENRLEWAWCRLTAFAECLGPDFVEAVQPYFQADRQAVESLMRNEDEVEGSPPPSSSVN